MRKLIALLLTLALVISLASAAFAADAYTLDIYWIANVNTDKPLTDERAAIEEYLTAEDPGKTELGKALENAKILAGVEGAINDYLAELHKADRKFKKMQVKIHLIPWDPAWTEQAIGALMNDEKIDLFFTADWEGYVKEIVLTVKYSGQYHYSYGDKYFDKELIELYKTYPKYLYLRLRDPGMYARLELRYANASRENIYLEFEGVVNPYGSRSLEPLLSIYDKKKHDIYSITDKEREKFREFFKCRDEAKKAMEQQRLVPRPPFEQCVEEGRAFY